MKSSISMTKKLIGIIVSGALLAGCSTTRVANDNYKKDVKMVDAGIASTTSRYKRNIEVRDDVYISGKSFKMVKHQALPSVFYKKVVYNYPFGMSTDALVDVVSRDTGLSITVDKNMDNSRGGGGSGGEGESSGGGDDSSVEMSLVSDDSGSSFGGSLESALPVNFSGSVKEFLDSFTDRMDLSWKYENGRVFVYRYETRDFPIDSIIGTVSLSSSVNSTAQSGSSGAGGGSDEVESSSQSQESSQSLSVAAENMNVWSSVESFLRNMMSRDGLLAKSEVAGYVYITDRPRVLDKIESVVDKHNKIISRQIAVNVEVYEVTTDNSAEYGIDWDGIYSSMQRLGVEFSTNAASGMNSSLITATVNSPGSGFDGTQAFIRALNQQGRVSLVTTSSAMTMNGTPVPIQVMDERAYLAEQAVTVEGETTTTELTPGKVKTGFSMSVLPRISGNGQVLMQLSMELSKLDAITTYSSGSSSIQLPEVNVKHFLQRAKMGSGETLVLAGFQRTQNQANHEGLTGASTWFLGGKKSSGTSKSTMVVLVTPYIMSE